MRRPVFVDHTGRRRRAAIVLGSGLGVLLVVGLIMLTAGLLSGAPVRLPGWPDTAQGDLEGTVPTPAAVTQPTSSKAPAAKPTVSVPAPQPSVTATGPGNGNGNSHGRPSKTPGKP